ncbi:MAG: sensor histidine kinase, partial [Myxococcota bacterium]
IWKLKPSWITPAASMAARTRSAMRCRPGSPATRRMSVVPVPMGLVFVVVGASGGVDSPLFLMFPMLTVFLFLFLRPVFGVVFATLALAYTWTLATIAVEGHVTTLMPALFGGGASASPPALLLTRAVFYSMGIGWAALLGYTMRRAYQSAIQRAVDAHDQLLDTQDESTRTLTTLAAEIAHELKNPLASVKGLAALVDRDAEGKTKDRLTVLRREVDRMQEILESFLTFSRPLVPLDVAPVRLAELAEQVAALHEGVIHERGVTIRLDARPNVEVKADARKIKQVIINLVQNALDATPPGGAVDVVVAPDGTGARVLVMDRGPGVVDVERAFEPGVTTKDKGNGLGLTVSRLVARQHGGDVRLSPRDGGGTVAELTLPGSAP